MSTMSRRRFTTALVAVSGLAIVRRVPALAAPVEIKVPDNLPAERFDFETKGIDGWTIVDGQWTVEVMRGAPSGKNVLGSSSTVHRELPSSLRPSIDHPRSKR